MELKQLVSQGPSTAVKNSASQSGSVETRSARILVVEDDPFVSRSLCIRIADAGYSVDTAFDGMTATRQILAQAPDLILLDLSIPAGDGFSVLNRLRTIPETAELPVIVLTASKRAGVEQQVRNLGVVEFFEKPFESWKVLEAISGALQAD